MRAGYDVPFPPADRATRRFRSAPVTIRFVLLALVLIATGLAGHPLPGFAAAWKQERFLVGGFSLALPESMSYRDQLAKLDSLGFDWVNDGGYEHYARGIAASADSLRREVPATRIQALLSLGCRFNEYFSSPCCTTGVRCRIGDRNCSFRGRIFMNDAADQSAERARIEQELRPDTRAPHRTNYASTMGWFVWDEPDSAASFEDIAAVTDLIETSDHTNPDAGGFGPKLAYVNLFPIDVWVGDTEGCNQYRESFGTADMVTAYENYLSAYLEGFADKDSPAPVLSADHYPFINARAVGAYYFLNLKVLDRMARRYSRPGQTIPWWMVIQLANVGATATPTLAMTRWQAFTALAYGARGIAYWSLARVGDFTNGLLLPTGQVNPAKVGLVTSLNRSLHALGPTLMHLDHVATGHKAAGNQAGIGDELLGSGGAIDRLVTDITGTGSSDAMVGSFRHDQTGDTWLLVVNKSVTTRRTFTLQLASRVEQVGRIDQVTGQVVAIAAGVTRFDALDLAPGGGELYRIHD